jgi:hypothetical protein
MMAIDLRSIKAFLNRPGVEGPQHLRGYIPCNRKADGKGRNYIGPDGMNPGEVPYPSTGDPSGFTAMGVSGVTVATGVDLGQTDADTLLKNGLDGSIVASLRPYLGLRSGAALKKLHDLPLQLFREPTDALDTAILSIHARNIPARYNRDKPQIPFEGLPWQAQAAIFSLLFQRGTGVAGKAPVLWTAFLRGAWHDAGVLLRDPSMWTGDQAQYRLRRKMEGELLLEIA